MPTYTDLKKKGTNEIVYPNIQGQNIPNSAITESKIAPGAVTNSKIATGAVTHEKMSQNSVGGQEIITDSIESFHITDNAIIASKIKIETITLNSLLGNNDFQELASVISSILRDPKVIRIYFDDGPTIETFTIEYSTTDSEINYISIYNGSITITNDTEASNFITNYAPHIKIVQFATA